MTIKFNDAAFHLYRVLVPKPLRAMIRVARLQKRIAEHFGAQDPESITDQQREVLEFVASRGVQTFPYRFAEKYVAEDIEVRSDRENGLKYVLRNGKKLYFKRRWSKKKIQRCYRDLMMEQDGKSPHRYLSDQFEVGVGDVIADFGAAEGNVSLDLIERVDKIYLFECDKEWIEALHATFAPWRDKVEIVAKFVSDKDDRRHCSGDVFFKDRAITFMKIDVDGGERSLLRGFRTIIRDRLGMKIALCTYHQHEDEAEFTELLEGIGYKVTPSRGYMIFYYDKKLRAPYLRRALIRAERGPFSAG